MSGGEVSGVDLARQALLAAREAAKRNGATSKKPRRRTGTAVGRDGREPLGLGSAISRMMAERGMVAPASASGSVLAHFDAILAVAVPELAGRAHAVACDADTGRLDVVPETSAAGTALRWSAPKLVAAANERVQGANRAVHVLAPAPVKAGPATVAAAPDPQPSALTAPVQRRTPPEGYRRAIEAHREAAVPSRVDPGIADAVERQTAAMRELSRRAFPEPPSVPADVPAPRRSWCTGRSRWLRSHPTPSSWTPPRWP